MACNTGCQDVAGVPPPSARPAGRPPASCMGGFCDDGLLGLPESPALDLVGVPAGDDCLHRMDAVKGVWQHDPNHPGGADFVGALDRLEFLLGQRVASGDDGGFGKVPILLPGYDAQGKASLEVVPQDVGENAAGFLSVMRQNQCGDVRQDKLVPAALDGCPDNLFLLGMVKTLRTCGNREYVDYAFKEISKLVLPSTQVPSLTADEMLDGDNVRTAAWRKSGQCWELGVAPKTGCSYLSPVAPADEFDYIMVCKSGVPMKLGGIAGKTLIGLPNGRWKVKAEQSNKLIYTYTGSIQTLTVPDDVYVMTAKLWGANSGDDPPGANRYGGGYTMIKIAVVPGTQYAVMVGQKGNRSPGAAIFGFGGPAHDPGTYLNASGGGLTGIFTGTSAVAAADYARAVAIAGGAGALGVISNVIYLEGDNGGNDSGGGGQSNMQGLIATAADGNGGGGGGYRGGSLNKGGTGFTDPAAIENSVLPGVKGSQANAGDSDFVSQGGDGYAVFYFQ
jgi:hypothetical protein